MNMNLEWQPLYSVGNEQLDAHHKRILGLTNKLYNAVKDGEEEHAILEILQSLTKYAEVHFKEEELLFSQTSYPNAYGHRCRHQEFRITLQQLKDSFQQKERFVGLELMEFLMSWLNGHILQIDMQYVPFIKNISSASTSPTATSTPAE